MCRPIRRQAQDLTGPFYEDLRFDAQPQGLPTMIAAPITSAEHLSPLRPLGISILFEGAIKHRQSRD